MLESLKRNRKGVLLMICSSICACIGQLFWKLSATKGIVFLLMGFAVYGAGALIMIIAYRYGKLSVLQPVLSLNYALGIVLGFVFLGETITALRVIGVLIIICGVILIAGGDKE